MTRVAKLNPQMWTELFFDNKQALIHEIDGLTERLKEYSEALKQGDSQRMEKLLQLGLEAKLASDEKEKNR